MVITPLQWMLATLVAWHAGYSPGFEPYPTAPLASVVTCQELAWPEVHGAVTSCGQGEGSLQVGVDYTPGGATLRVGHGSVWVDGATTLGGLEVYSGHLNGDSGLDVVVVFIGSGCGLASEHCTAVFALSGDDGHAFTRLGTMGFGPEDMVRLPGERGVQVIHTAFVGGEAGRDGRVHNYWVYTAFRVAGGSLELIEGRDPVWIMYAERENHVPTRQLTSEQKHRLRREQGYPLWETLHRTPARE